MATTFRNAAGTVSVALVTETCYSCGVVFAMATEFKNQRLKDHHSFYCPAGHGQHYIGQNEEERLRKELEQAEQRLASEQGWSQRLSDKLEEERKAHATTKGQLTKTRNRAKAGVCLDCNRTFSDVAKHQRDKHGGSDKMTGARVAKRKKP